jgi:hypothetical protein
MFTAQSMTGPSGSGRHRPWHEGDLFASNL